MAFWPNAIAIAKSNWPDLYTTMETDLYIESLGVEETEGLIWHRGKGVRSLKVDTQSIGSVPEKRTDSATHISNQCKKFLVKRGIETLPRRRTFTFNGFRARQAAGKS